MFFFGYLILLVVAALLARWVVEAFHGGSSALPPGDGAELARLREEVDLLAGEVQRLSDEQSFMVRLLAEGDRPPAPGPHPGDDAAPEIPNEENP
jgi:hypothetical protein